MHHLSLSESDRRKLLHDVDCCIRAGQVRNGSAALQDTCGAGSEWEADVEEFSWEGIPMADFGNSSKIGPVSLVSAINLSKSKPICHMSHKEALRASFEKNTKKIGS